MADPDQSARGRSLAPEALSQLLDVTRKLAAPFDLMTMLGEVVGAAKELLNADAGSLWLYEPEPHELVMRVALGIEPVRVSADRGIVGECVRQRALINVPDCYADSRFNPEVDRASGYVTRCMLTLPLVGHDDALVGVLQIVNKRQGTFDSGDEQVAAALAAQCAVALQRVQMTEALVAGERLRQEIAVAREVQMSSLPRGTPVLPGYELHGEFHPADETGGDTFDFVSLPGDRLFVLLGDATGHGVGPALSVTQMQAMLRVVLRLGTGLDEAYREVNNLLDEQLPPERFITAFLGLLDVRSHALEYHAAGQGPLLHLHAADGRFERLLPTSFPMGAFALAAPRAPARRALAPGDLVALVSDGIFEWPGPDGGEFGVERVEALLRGHATEPLPRLAERLREAAATYGGDRPQDDDVTIVLVRRQPDGGGSAWMEADLARDLAALEDAVSLVQRFWTAHGLPAGERFAVDFAIEELFTNMLKYGKPSRTTIGLRLQREPGAVAVRLTDPDSEPFDPTARAPVDVDAPLEARTPGGLGLHLIPRLVDDFAFEYVGRESRLTFRRRTGN